MRPRQLRMAAAACLLLGLPNPAPASAQATCDADNGIGPDGALEALPPPADPDARWLDLADGSFPVDMVQDPASGHLFVVERGYDDVLTIDARADQPAVLGITRVGKRPTAIALDEHGQRLFVANGSSCSISVLDARVTPPTVLATLDAASGPRAIAVDQATGRAYAANWSGDEIGVIDGRADPPVIVGDPLVVGPGHVAAVVEPVSGSLVTAGRDGLRAWSLESGAPRGGALPLNGPYDATTDGTGRVYISQLSDGSIVAAEVAADHVAITGSGPVGSNPFDVRYDPALAALLVSTTDGDVAFVDPDTLYVGTVVPSTPGLAAVAYDPVAERLWMLEYTHHRLSSVSLGGTGLPSASPSVSPG